MNVTKTSHAGKNPQRPSIIVEKGRGPLDSGEESDNERLAEWKT